MITIYTTPTCVYCEHAKEYFRENNLEYSEVNVAEDEEAREKMIEKSGQMGVPVIDVNGQILVGFNKAKIEEALK